MRYGLVLPALTQKALLFQNESLLQPSGAAVAITLESLGFKVVIEVMW